MKKILLTVLMCLFLSSVAMAYPVRMDNTLMLQAKVDSVLVGKFGNDDVRQYSYMLGDKGYGFLSMQAPIKIDIETPYSTAKYRFYKESTIYTDFTDSDKENIIANSNTVNIITRCNAMAAMARFIPLPARNVVVKKDGVVYKSVPNEITNYYSSTRKWTLPIELFDGSSDIEIIVIDIYDNAKALKVNKEKLFNIK